MQNNQRTPSTPMEQLASLSRLYVKHYMLWLAPVLICTTIAAAYAMMKKPTYQASQSMHVRDEAIGTIARPGQFSDTDARKTAQETVLEVARSHQVVAAALKTVGREPGKPASGDFPSNDDIESLRDGIKVSAPRGAELGQTEVIYLSVRAASTDRAIALTDAISEQLVKQLGRLRDLKTKSVIDELTRRRDLAKADLEVATRQLEEMERAVGRDLATLRSMNQTGGNSQLSSAQSEIKNEIRVATRTLDTSKQLQKYLQAARGDTYKLVATPNSLLESQPALRRLKDGLIDKQLKTAEMLGTMNAEHPQVKAALVAEQEIRDDLQAELALAIRALNTDIQLAQSQIESLERQSNKISDRLDRLAGLRARYGNLVAEVDQRSNYVEQSEQELSQARASQASAALVSLVTRIDQPRAGMRPVGPGKKIIVLAGLAGGLLIGMGSVLLMVPQSRGRRRNDPEGGRRATDVTETAVASSQANATAELPEPAPEAPAPMPVAEVEPQGNEPHQIEVVDEIVEKINDTLNEPAANIGAETSFPASDVDERDLGEPDLDAVASDVAELTEVVERSEVTLSEESLLRDDWKPAKASPLNSPATPLEKRESEPPAQLDQLEDVVRGVDKATAEDEEVVEVEAVAVEAVAVEVEAVEVDVEKVEVEEMAEAVEVLDDTDIDSDWDGDVDSDLKSDLGSNLESEYDRDESEEDRGAVELKSDAEEPQKEEPKSSVRDTDHDGLPVSKSKNEEVEVDEDVECVEDAAAEVADEVEDVEEDEEADDLSLVRQTQMMPRRHAPKQEENERSTMSLTESLRQLQTRQ